VIPWRLIGYGVAALVILSVLWWLQSRIRISYQAEHRAKAAETNLANYRRSVETQARVAHAQQIEDQKKDAALTAHLAALEADNAAIRRALLRMSSTVEKPDAEGVPRLSVNPDAWLCVSTFVSRDAADRAACEARAGTGRVPDAISR
jgi:hypothetical protein